MNSSNHSKNTNFGNVTIEKGDMKLGDSYYKSAEYKEMQKTINRLEKLMQYAEDDVERLQYSKELNEERDKLKGFKKEVIALAEIFQRISLDTERLQKAKQHFDKGEFKEARAVLDAEVMGKELDALLVEKEQLENKTTTNTKHLSNKADEFLILAQLTAVDFDNPKRFEETVGYFEKSLQANRNAINLFDYAMFLHKYNNPIKAFLLIEESIEKYKVLSEIIPKIALQPYVANALNLAANIAVDIHEYSKAEFYYELGLKEYRDLVQDFPDQFLIYFADNLNNLGDFYLNQNNFDNSQKNLEEAYEIYNELSIKQPELYTISLANCLNNIGRLMAAKGQIPEAKRKYEEAIKKLGEYKDYDSVLSLQYLANTINNLSILHSRQGEFGSAILSMNEVLCIRKDLVLLDPLAFSPDLATSFHNLGNFHYENNELNDAEKHYKEALRIRRQLKKVDKSYSIALAGTLHNLGSLQIEKEETKAAKQNLEEALQIYAPLAEETPEFFAIKKAKVLSTLSWFYQKIEKNQELSVDCIDEAMILMFPYFDILAVQEQIPFLDSILENWGIDGKEHIEQLIEKMNDEDFE